MEWKKEAERRVEQKIKSAEPPATDCRLPVTIFWQLFCKMKRYFMGYHDVDFHRKNQLYHLQLLILLQIARLSSAMLLQWSLSWWIRQNWKLTIFRGIALSWLTPNAKSAQVNALFSICGKIHVIFKREYNLLSVITPAAGKSFTSAWCERFCQ